MPNTLNTQDNKWIRKKHRYGMQSIKKWQTSDVLTIPKMGKLFISKHVWFAEIVVYILNLGISHFKQSIQDVNPYKVSKYCMH